MGKRHNNLDAAIKLLRSNNGQGPITVDLSGTPLGNYRDYKAGNIVVSYPRDPDSKPGSLVEVEIVPFATGNTDPPVIVSLSSRSESALANLGISATDLNHGAVSANARIVRGFQPAKATIFKDAATQEDTLVDSQITGLKYNPREGNSYTFPFGQKPSGTGAELTEAGVAAGIRGAIADDERVSFKHEKYPY